MQYCSKIVCEKWSTQRWKHQSHTRPVGSLWGKMVDFHAEQPYCLTLKVYICPSMSTVWEMCFICPPAGDMPPYLSKPQRILGGWCLQAAEGSSPAANGSQLPLGTVRCYFYDYVLNVCPVCTTAFPAPWHSSLTLSLFMSKSQLISMPW